MATQEHWLKTCPLCGGDNQCGMAAGSATGPCWCQDADISTTALAAIPADSRGKRCLCPACGHPEGDTNHAR